jgi:isopentenyldiphosphate isomerase
MPEYLDIVDEEDRVIGRDTRRRVHDAHAIHRGVHVFVIASDGRILVQRRSREKDYYPGYYDISVGAQVQSGESYEEAAARELMEELGCHTGPLSELGKYNAYSDRQREKRMVFVHDCDGPFRPDPAEVESIEFLTPDEVAQLMEREPVTEGFKRSFALFRGSDR